MPDQMIGSRAHSTQVLQLRYCDVIGEQPHCLQVPRPRNAGIEARIEKAHYERISEDDLFGIGKTSDRGNH
jgi:hypothetical protein